MIIDSDLGKISTWAIDWSFDFHPRKAVAFLMSLSGSSSTPLYIYNTVLGCHKHLGITFSNSCDWKEHNNCISKWHGQE